MAASVKTMPPFPLRRGVMQDKFAMNEEFENLSDQ